MRHDKLERELSLILLLTENNKYGVDELCDKVGISRRNLYYYLEFLRDCGFKVYIAIGQYSPYYAMTDDSSEGNMKILEVTDKEIVVVSADAMSMEKSPFKTVQTLADYIDELLKNV